jgi:hypothetical protein|tara:strand:+ start:523 stop:1200 length:678 start_codon:yes stop_codon:yes gene_type:complete
MSQIISTFIPELIVGNDYDHYMSNIFQTLPVIGENKEISLLNSISQADDEGYWLEFGVHEGETIMYTAGHKLGVPNFKIYGFDSFEGLPEDWIENNPKGHFNLDGKIPDHLLQYPNIDIIKGWFDKTLPKFIKDNDINKISFLNVDSDLYSSANAILTLLTPYFKGDCIIHFDEFCNYPGGENGEYKAFSEFLHKNKSKINTCESLGIGMPYGFSVAAFRINFKE